MSGVTVGLNSVQKIPDVPIVPRRVVVQPRTWYTCPAGKKAFVRGSVACTGRGAAATADFKAGGEIMYRWTNAGPATLDANIVPRLLSTPQYAEFLVELAAGEIIETVQDSGTNAEFNLFAEVKETPA